MQTIGNQTPLELSTEFINALIKVKAGCSDMDILFDWYVEQEALPVPSDTIMDSITHVNHTPVNAMEVPFIKNCHPKVSYVLLAWISMQSGAIPDCIETMLGMYCTYFYSTHGKNEKVTLKWLGETVGKGKLLDFKGIWPWFCASKTESGKSCWSTMTPEDLYTAQYKKITHMSSLTF